MSADMPEVEAYAAAVLEELKSGLEAGCSVSLTARRVAALYELHKMLNPWQPCQCDFCAFHVKLGHHFAPKL